MNFPHNGILDKILPSLLINCRACFQVIEYQENRYALSDCEINIMLATCTDLQMNNNNCPQGICQMCYDQLLVAYNFKCRAQMLNKKYQETFISPLDDMVNVNLNGQQMAKPEEVYIVEHGNIALKQEPEDWPEDDSQSFLHPTYKDDQITKPDSMFNKLKECVNNLGSQVLIKANERPESAHVTTRKPEIRKRKTRKTNPNKHSCDYCPRMFPTKILLMKHKCWKPSKITL